MLEREAVADAPAAVVPGKAKTNEAERLHRLYHRLCHCTLGVGRMVGLRRRHGRPAVTGQIGDHQRETFGKRRRYAMPHDVALRMPVKKQKRRSTGAVYPGKDFSSRSLDPARGEAGIEIGEV